MRKVLSFGATLVLSGLLLANIAAAQVDHVPAVDNIFHAYSGTDRPGCVVGVSQGQEIVLERAYGMANLEYGVVNTPQTVMEPGSVSKQFTTAATVLLALDGAISLDDDVRTYIPELPDYGEAISIRHLMNHTSGLRDWGSMASIGGWPRTTRRHTHTHMLDIASRQQSLNYAPGTYYSYTNTGYNLQAVLVDRVSGMAFEEFSRTRIFEPLGLTNTAWRADYTRVVPNRATAYRQADDGSFHMLMPFENVHGNGGLLTTVGDLLRFTWNLETGRLGGADFVGEMHTQGVLNSGRTISYASGLFVGTYRGLREVQHSGATAGYRGFLTRFPDRGLAVAVMCNTSGASAGSLAHAVADLYLGDIPEPPGAVFERYDLSQKALEDFAGGFKRNRDQTFLPISAQDGQLRAQGTLYSPVSATHFLSASGRSLTFTNRDMALIRLPNGEEYLLERVEAYNPSAEELQAFVGRYVSEEAETQSRVVVEDGELKVVDRYGEARQLAPLYPDAFRLGSSTIIFRRDGEQVNGLSLVQSRVWDLRFQKVE